MIKVFKGSTEYTSDIERAVDSPLTLSFTSGAASIEVRSLKPLTKLFFDTLSNNDSTSLHVHYWDGSAFTSQVSNIVDNTKTFERYGFVSWTNPTSGMVKDGDYYRYRFQLDGLSTSANIVFRFIGVVFCQEHDLLAECPDALEYRPDGDKTLNRFIISAKNDIVQNFRNKGNYVSSVSGVSARDLTEFDFNEPDQLKMAAVYLSLEKLFFWRSQDIDDKWIERSRAYNKKYGDSINVFFASIDSNGDGKSGALDNEFGITTGVIYRV